ncbi:family 43 glycosylhydrolase [Haloferula sargassicola]|uniref:3-keto-alpha-glucoside-1,2-lyase/3-keto-2-hydroxy-glucal hydratase domain-containing protein n=1 Tax=Haloferula sargassicola TaxID=490096 RepID=A0ABP9ULI3_9BACT
MLPRIAAGLFLMVTATAPAKEIRADMSRYPAAPWVTHGGDWKTDGDALTVSGGEGPMVSIDGLQLTDFQLDLEIRTDAQAGVVFRGRDFGVGAFRGDYVGIDAAERQLVWGANDPDWQPIASQAIDVAKTTWLHLRIQADGDQVKVFADAKPITAETWPVFDGIDEAFTRGGLALRALDGEAAFRNLTIQPYHAPRLRRSYTNPVLAGAADPVVLFHQGTYYAYATYTLRDRKQGIRLFTSRNLVDWNDEGFALEADDTWGDSKFWAPDIVEKDGTFFLYYAAEERMCVATAKTPRGPFRQEIEAPMEPASIRIDGHVFEDDDGSRYFYYVTFGEGNEIWGGRLQDDMTSVDPSSLRRMVMPDQPWERHRGAVTEGPEILKHEGTYYLTYSGSHFLSTEYSVGYATSDHPLGPWTKFRNNPVMKSTRYAHGSGHHCFTTSPDGKELFIVYHRHQSSTRANPRQLSIDRARFVPDPQGGPDILQIHGPTSSSQPMPLGTR